jgi:DNA-binding MarR family transcriptional regulator
MNSTFQVISELIDYLKRFESEKGKEPRDVKDFLLWLNHLLFDHREDRKSTVPDRNLDMELTFLLITQNKHYKSYCKKALVNTQIYSPDEYSFLYHLSLVDSFRKMELVQIHLLEAPSGIEVIKRLLKKGFIEEFDDPDDRRAKRIRITPKGKKENDRLAPKMQIVYTKMAAELSLSEKLHLISYLKKLNDYHSMADE